jgi:hypothetical protein
MTAVGAGTKLSTSEIAARQAFSEAERNAMLAALANSGWGRKRVAALVDDLEGQLFALVLAKRALATPSFGRRRKILRQQGKAASQLAQQLGTFKRSPLDEPRRVAEQLEKLKGSSLDESGRLGEALRREERMARALPSPIDARRLDQLARAGGRPPLSAVVKLIHGIAKDLFDAERQLVRDWDQGTLPSNPHEPFDVIARAVAESYMSHLRELPTFSVNEAAEDGKGLSSFAAILLVVATKVRGKRVTIAQLRPAALSAVRHMKRTRMQG